MKKSTPYLRTLAPLALALCSSAATALPISEYGLIVEEDFGSDSSVYGKAFIGRNLVGGVSSFGSHLGGDFSGNALTVVGNITANGVTLQNGGLTHGGTIASGTTINYNGIQKFAQQGNLSDLVNQKNTLIDELKSASTQYSQKYDSQDALTSANITHNNLNLTYSGPASIAYFSLDGEDIFSNSNFTFNLNAGTAETVIINVSGKDIAATSSIGMLTGLNNGPFSSAYDNEDHKNNILWNFFEAEKLTLDTQGKFVGSILAMSAEILKLSEIDGSVAAKSLIGHNREIHDYTFNPPTPVPLPASANFLLAGALLMGWLRFRKRKSTL